MQSTYAVRIGALAVLIAGFVSLIVLSGRAEASSYTSVSAGGLHTCAKTTAGGLECWGDNTYGQRGDGTTVTPGVATAVSGLSSGVSQFDVGTWHSCAVISGGTLKCWGRNLHGQLGIGTGVDLLPSPIDVCASGNARDGSCVELTAIAQVSAGDRHTCAVTTAGGVKCWGANSRGQLGDGTTDDSPNPVDVSGLSTGVASVSTGGLHTCARLTDNTVKCWGANDSGQLGNGTTTDSSVPVSAATGAAAVSAGGRHTCLLQWFLSLVKCWGANGAGQLGNNDPNRADQTTPVSTGLTGAGQVASGGLHTCARVGGAVKCWGWNLFDQVGNGLGGADPQLQYVIAPVNVLGIGGTGEPVASASLTGGSAHNCVLTTTNVVKCWGWNQSPTPDELDLDRDGCQDEAELGSDEEAGGLRNPKYYWDFYDVWTPKPGGGWERDKMVTQADQDAINDRFGAEGDPTGDPFVPPTNSTGYHTAYDRGPQIGPNPWDVAPPDGNIDLFNDILGAGAQIGHSCT